MKHLRSLLVDEILLVASSRYDVFTTPPCTIQEDRVANRLIPVSYSCAQQPALLCQFCRVVGLWHFNLDNRARAKVSDVEVDQNAMFDTNVAKAASGQPASAHHHQRSRISAPLYLSFAPCQKSAPCGSRNCIHCSPVQPLETMPASRPLTKTVGVTCTPRVR